MVKKLLLIMAFTFALAMAGPVGEARATTNTAEAIQVVQAHEIAQAQAVVAYIEATLAMGKPLSITSEQLAVLARPAGFWGWAKCIASVVVLVGGTGWVAIRLSMWIRKAGSIKRAIMSAQAKINRMPKYKQKAEAFKVLRDVGLEALGIIAVYDACFNS